MLIRELSPDVLVVVLKIYVQQQTFLKESQLVQMSLRLAYILQVHQFMLNLQEMEGLQILWRQVQLLRLHSADHALVLERDFPEGMARQGQGIPVRGYHRLAAGAG